jgi:predicted ArsR family transcriptional regulator
MGDLAARQAAALGDATRFAIFRWLVHLRRPADVVELAEVVEVHPNAVRRHLRTLADAGLVLESVSPPEGRGRPRHRFSVAPDHADPQLARQRYAELARLLAEAVRTGATAREVGRRAGAVAHVGVGGAAAEPSDELGTLLGYLEDWGFAPEASRPPEGDEHHRSVRLHACPFAGAAEDEPAAICSLHLGLVEGVAEQLPHLQVHDLVVRPPAEGACELHVTIGLDGGPRHGR